MNATANRRMLPKATSTGQAMSRGMIASLVFHAVFVAVGIFGIPYVKKDLPDLAPPIPIEMVDIADITQTNIPAVREIPKPPEDAKPEPPKPEPERPKQAPQQRSETPPRPVAPPKEELTIPEKAKEPEKKVEKKPVEKPPTPIKRPARAEEKPPEPQEDPFQSLLKNLQEAKPETVPDAQGTEAKPQQAQPLPLGDRMTMSELDALRQQLAQCWNVLAGARYAEDLVVDIKLFMSIEGFVQQASVVDQLRYNGDSIFRAAADSALRAVRDPSCSPFRLPREKYQQWKEMTVTFDPRQIL